MINFKHHQEGAQQVRRFQHKLPQQPTQGQETIETSVWIMLCLPAAVSMLPSMCNFLSNYS